MSMPAGAGRAANGKDRLEVVGCEVLAAMGRLEVAYASLEEAIAAARAEHGAAFALEMAVTRVADAQAEVRALVGGFTAGVAKMTTLTAASRIGDLLSTIPDDDGPVPPRARQYRRRPARRAGGQLRLEYSSGTGNR